MNFFNKKRGRVGIAFWDHGQRNKENVEFYTIDPNFYKTDLEYKLTEYKYYLTSCEMQTEASYLNEYNNSWAKIDLLKCNEFKHFLVNNNFWSVHIPASEIDICCFNDHNHRMYAVEETKKAIDFGFDNFVDAFAMHPGNYNLLFNNWPNRFEIGPLLERRSNAFYQSLKDILGHFVFKLNELEIKISDYCKNNKNIVNKLKKLFNNFHFNSLDDHEFYKNLSDIMTLTKKNRVPIYIIRYCKDPTRGIHLCLENVEPPNFLINSPYQLRNWYWKTSEIYWEYIKKFSIPHNIAQKYFPYMLVDNNHFLHSQHILLEPNNDYILNYIDGANELFRPYLKLPGQYSNSNEPLLNKFIREHENDIFYFHIGGCKKFGNILNTHEPVRALRNNMYMVLNSKGLPVPKYSTTQFDVSRELNINEAIQIIGFNKQYMLEVFNKSSELIRSSQLHVSEYIKFIYKEYKRTGNIIKDHINRMIFLIKNNELKVEYYSENEFLYQLTILRENLRKAKFYIKPKIGNESENIGYDEAGFYNDSDGFQNIIATIKDDNGKIWLNIPES